METKEIKSELEKALTIIRDIWSDDDKTNYQLEEIEDQIIKLINKN